MIEEQWWVWGNEDYEPEASVRELHVFAQTHGATVETDVRKHNPHKPEAPGLKLRFL